MRCDVGFNFLEITKNKESRVDQLEKKGGDRKREGAPWSHSEINLTNFQV